MEGVPHGGWPRSCSTQVDDPPARLLLHHTACDDGRGLGGKGAAVALWCSQGSVTHRWLPCSCVPPPPPTSCPSISWRRWPAGVQSARSEEAFARVRADSLALAWCRACRLCLPNAGLAHRAAGDGLQLLPFAFWQVRSASEVEARCRGTCAGRQSARTAVRALRVKTSRVSCLSSSPPHMTLGETGTWSRPRSVWQKSRPCRCPRPRTAWRWHTRETANFTRHPPAAGSNVVTCASTSRAMPMPSLSQ